MVGTGPGARTSARQRVISPLAAVRCGAVRCGAVRCGPSTAPTGGQVCGKGTRDLCGKEGLTTEEFIDLVAMVARLRTSASPNSAPVTSCARSYSDGCPQFQCVSWQHLAKDPKATPLVRAETVRTCKRKCSHAARPSATAARVALLPPIPSQTRSALRHGPSSGGHLSARFDAICSRRG